MRYELSAWIHTRSAKTKAGVFGGLSGDLKMVLEARDDEHAWEQVQKLVLPNDKRRLQGFSYVRNGRVKDIRSDGTLTPMDLKVGDRVVLHEPFKGEYRKGAISEVLSPTTYSIALDGYDNPFVDFSTREFVPLPKEDKRP